MFSKPHVVGAVASWRDAVTAVPGGTRILVEAHPGAKAEAFPDGFNAWREGRIGVRVRAQAQEGAANEAVIDAVAAFFRIPRAGVRIESGATDRRKTLHVAVGYDAVVARLAEVLL